MTKEKLQLTAEGSGFLAEWLSVGDFVEARTSGSTGSPKAILLPKNDMRVSARATNLFFGIDRDSLLVCPLSADYIAGKMMIVRAVEAGCRLIMLEPSNHIAAGVAKIVDDNGKIDLLPLVPSQCESLISDVDTASIRNVIVGGAPVSSKMERVLSNLDCSVWATYGMTETCSHVAVRPMGRDIYEAMPGVTFSADNDGKLTIEAPRYSFSELHTNDIVGLVDNRHFRWIGRADNVINSGGIKIFPEQLESLLAPDIPYPFYFKGEADDKWGTRLIMVAQCPESETDRLRDICRLRLQPYQVPKEIRCVSELPKASNGKIKRL